MGPLWPGALGDQRPGQSAPDHYKESYHQPRYLNSNVGIIQSVTKTMLCVYLTPGAFYYEKPGVLDRFFSLSYFKSIINIRDYISYTMSSKNPLSSYNTLIYNISCQMDQGSQNPGCQFGLCLAVMSIFGMGAELHHKICPLLQITRAGPEYFLD